MFTQTPNAVFEDLLACLPVSLIGEFPKGVLIYGPDRPSSGIYLVIAGKVKVFKVRHDGRQVVLDVYQTDELFGESCLVSSTAGEAAMALDTVRVMSWSADQIHEIVLKRPGLGLALLHMAIQRSVEFGNRIESLSFDDTERRTVAALLHFAAKLGTATHDGGREMMAFTQGALSKYICTSRVMVTHHMNAFRRKGCLKYSRKSIIVFEDALRESDCRRKSPRCR